MFYPAACVGTGRYVACPKLFWPFLMAIVSDAFLPVSNLGASLAATQQRNRLSGFRQQGPPALWGGSGRSNPQLVPPCPSQRTATSRFAHPRTPRATARGGSKTISSVVSALNWRTLLRCQAGTATDIKS